MGEKGDECIKGDFTCRWAISHNGLDVKWRTRFDEMGAAFNARMQAPAVANARIKMRHSTVSFSIFYAPTHLSISVLCQQIVAFIIMCTKAENSAGCGEVLLIHFILLKKLNVKRHFLSAQGNNY